MKKIPTAEEVLSKKFSELKSSFDFNDVKDCMIEFAKIHVEAAINACIEDAPSGSSTDTVSYEDVVEALKDVYPLENIK